MKLDKYLNESSLEIKHYNMKKFSNETKKEIALLQSAIEKSGIYSKGFDKIYDIINNVLEDVYQEGYESGSDDGFERGQDSMEYLRGE